MRSTYTERPIELVDCKNHNILNTLSQQNFTEDNCDSYYLIFYLVGVLCTTGEVHGCMFNIVFILYHFNTLLHFLKKLLKFKKYLLRLFQLLYSYFLVINYFN